MGDTLFTTTPSSNAIADQILSLDTQYNILTNEKFDRCRVLGKEVGLIRAIAKYALIASGNNITKTARTLNIDGVSKVLLTDFEITCARFPEVSIMIERKFATD